MTLVDPKPRFQSHGVTVDALDVLCVQLTRDLVAMAKFRAKIRMVYLRQLACCLTMS